MDNVFINLSDMVSIGQDSVSVFDNDNVATTSDALVGPPGPPQDHKVLGVFKEKPEFKVQKALKERQGLKDHKETQETLRQYGLAL